MDGERAVSTRYELRPAHEDTGGDARDRELEPWKSAISGLSTQGVYLTQWAHKMIFDRPQRNAGAAHPTELRNNGVHTGRRSRSPKIFFGAARRCSLECRYTYVGCCSPSYRAAK